MRRHSPERARRPLQRTIRLKTCLGTFLAVCALQVNGEAKSNWEPWSLRELQSHDL